MKNRRRLKMAEEIKIYDLREILERKKSLFVDITDNGEILNYSIDSEIPKILKFDKSKKNLNDFLNSSDILEKEDKNGLLDYFVKNVENEYDKDFTIADRFWHFHFGIQQMETGKIFFVRDETFLTHIKRDLEILKEHYQKDLATIAHEIRNPLVGSFGFARALLTELKEKELPRDYMVQKLEIVVKEGIRAEEMLNNILNAERIEHGVGSLKIEKINMLEDIIKPVLAYQEIVTLWNEKDVTIDKAASIKREQKPEIYVDKTDLQVVYRNLFHNALKYIQEGRRISFGVKKFMKDKEWWYEFNVYNGGEIIPENIRDKIFEKWFRTGEKEHGLGLGLYISKEIIKCYGGEMWAEPNRKEGANIIFTLPKMPKIKETKQQE